MTTSKKRTTIWLDPPVLRKLKMLGVVHNQPIGNIIEALVDFTEAGQFIKDEALRNTFQNLLEMSLINAGRRATWEGDPPEASIEAGQGPAGDDLDEA